MKFEYYIEDWVLYDYHLVSTKSTDNILKKSFADAKEKAKELRVFGTKSQIKEASKKYNIDEAYSYEIETRGSYWDGFLFSDNPNDDKPTLEEYNKRFINKYEYYLKLYKKNKNKILIIKML